MATTPTKTLGVGVIGAGRAGVGHAQAISQIPHLRLAGVSDVNAEQLERVKSRFGCDTCTDYNQLFARDDVDLIVIALPNHLHCPITLAAAQAGKHVFIEKPMALELDECDAMNEAARKYNIQLMVGHSEHYYPPNIKAKEILSSGTLGAIVFATDQWYKPFGLAQRAPWFLDRKQGGGMWQMNGAHMVDRVMWLMNDRVGSVKAWIGNPIIKQQADDSSIAFLQFENGKAATLAHSGYENGVEENMTVFTCTEGMLKVNSRPPDTGVWVSKNNVYEPVSYSAPLNGFAAELSDFGEAILNGREAPINGEYARHVVAVLLACEESARTGREVLIK